MATAFETYFNSLRGKRIAVLGLGVSNRPLVRLLLEFGCDVLGCDRTPREKLDAEVLQLEEMGCKVYLSNQDCNAEIETNGAYITRRIQEILAETGAEKINIIAHSKGGLDSRWAVSHLEDASCVASLTTLASPHHGSKTVDFLLKFPDFLVRFVGFCADIWCRFIGDQHPASYRVFHALTTARAAEFNRSTPNRASVYYQSYAFVMKHPFSDFFMWIPNLVVGWIEGENDGLLPPDAVKWGNFRGIYRGTGRRGISHLDELDFRRRPLSIRKGKDEMDLLDLYRQIVTELAEQGY